MVITNMLAYFISLQRSYDYFISMQIRISTNWIQLLYLYASEDLNQLDPSNLDTSLIRTLKLEVLYRTLAARHEEKYNEETLKLLSSCLLFDL